MISSQRAVIRQAAPDKIRLHALDECLGLLEDANERGEMQVSDQLAARFVQEAACLRAGMPIQDALDSVFGLQERILKGDPIARRSMSIPGGLHRVEAQNWEVDAPHPTSSGDDVGSKALSGDEARQLTDQIKVGVRTVCLLMVAAHNGRAWIPLGYSSWEAYVRSEFGFSRSRSYELLTHGRVVNAIQRAAGLSGMPDISTRLAMRLSSRLGDLEVAIQRQVAGGHADAIEVVASTISEFGKVQGRRKVSPVLYANDDYPRNSNGGPFDDERPSPRRWVYAQRFWLGDVIEYLAHMPAARDVVDVLGEEDLAQVTQLDYAVQQLSDLAAAWPRSREAISA